MRAVLPTIEDQTVDEGRALSINLGVYYASLIEGDVSLSLIPGNGTFPSGAYIRTCEDDRTMCFVWVPSEAQGPGVYDVGIMLSYRTGMSETEYFTITVREVNRDPIILLDGTSLCPDPTCHPLPAYRVKDELAELSFKVEAIDPDIDPYSDPQVVTLICGTCPSGSFFSPETGRFSWTPSISQGGRVKELVFKATDNGSPPLSTWASVYVTVRDLPPHVSLEISSATSLIGFRVQISGTVTDSGIGLPEALVGLSFFSCIPSSPCTPVFGLEQSIPWTPIRTIAADQNGRFSVQWIPTVTGDFLIKALTPCRISSLDHPCALDKPPIVALAVLPMEAGQVFSVATNSTLSGLAYDAVDATLTFRLSGNKGDGARVDLSIAKSLLVDASHLRVSANQSEVQYDIISIGDSWLVTFTVHFESAFLITMETTDGTAPFGSNTLSVYLAIIVGSGLAVAGPYLFYRQRKAQRSTTSQVPTYSSSSLQARK